MRTTDASLSEDSADQSADELLRRFDEYIIALARNQFPRSISIPTIFDLEVDEIVQITRIKLWSAYKKQPIYNIKAYIRTLVRHEIINSIRMHKKMQPLLVEKEDELSQGRVLMSTSHEMDDPSSTFDQQETVTECATVVAHAVQTLPPRQRRAMICALKENIDDFAPFLDASIARKMDFESTNWPKEEEEVQILKASLSIARKKLQAQLNLHSYQFTTPPGRMESRTMSNDSRSASLVEAEKYADVPLEVFHRLIAELPEPYHSSLHLHYVEKYAYTEVANKLNLPIGTVKSHVSRGKKLLQELLERTAHTGSFLSLPEGQRATFGEMEPFLYMLREPYQTVLRLHYGDGCSYLAIASRVGAPVGTVKSYTSRGMKMLRQLCPL